MEFVFTDITLNIFMYPFYVLHEIIFDNLYILTSQNFILLVFIFSFLLNLLFIPVFNSSLKDFFHKSDYSFLFWIIFFFCTSMIFFDENDLLSTIPFNIETAFLNFTPILIILNILAVEKIIKNIDCDNIKKLKIFRLITHSLYIFLAVFAYKMSDLFFIYQIFNSLFLLLYGFCLGKNKKFLINTFLITGITAFMPIAINIFFNSKIYGDFIKQIFILILILFTLFLLIRYFNKKELITKKSFSPIIIITTLLSISIWAGFYITSLIISASPTEFSYLGNISNPFYFVINTFSKFLGITLFLVLLHQSTDKKYQNIFTIFSVAVLLIIIFNINYMVFNGDFSTLSLDLKLNLNKLNSISNVNLIINTILCLLIFVGSSKFCLYSLKNNQKALKNTLFFILITGIIISVGNSFKIIKEYNKIKTIHDNQINISKDLNIKVKNNSELPQIINLSTQGKNVLIIFIDRAIGAFVKDIFETEPNLKNIYSGFVYYPNTVSFYPHTILGYPPMIAGYEYTPEEVNKRNDKKMVDKYNESLLMLPVLFKNNGYNSTVIEPPYENYEIVIKDGKIFKPFNIAHHVMNIDISDFYKTDDTASFLERNFLYFNIFVSSPSILKKHTYQNGMYKKIKPKSKKELIWDNYLIKEYEKLNSLSKITKIENSNKNTFTIFNNDILHINNYEKAFVQEHFDLEKTAFKIIGEYLNFLKSKNVYNNTRIIIVSDHGHWEQENNRLNIDFTSYNPILFFKDFNSNEPYKEDMSFMTNADAPIFAVKDIIPKPINPFTKKDITKTVQKSKVRIYTDHRNIPLEYQGTTCLKKGLNYIEVHDNIFQDKNWKKGKLQR